MLTSKQRAMLKGLASNEDTILHIGRNGITDTLLIQAADALTARELIKLKVQEGCVLTPHEAAEKLSKASKSDIVQVIGNKFVLFKRNHKEPKIILSSKKEL